MNGALVKLQIENEKPAMLTVCKRHVADIGMWHTYGDVITFQ